MNKILTALLIFVIIPCCAQKIELGLNGGGNISTSGQQGIGAKYYSDYGGLVSVRGNIILEKISAGMVLEVGAVNRRYSFYDFYSPAWAPKVNEKTWAKTSNANPYYAFCISGNFSLVRRQHSDAYAGLLAGYITCRGKSKYPDYDSSNNQIIWVEYKTPQRDAIMLGTHFGYTYYLKKIGFNAEAGLRYLVMGPRYDMAPKYNVLFFPLTVGIRYRL